MSETRPLPAPEGSLGTRLRAWRESLARTFVQPASVTLLSLDAEEVGRRLRGDTDTGPAPASNRR